MNTTETDGRDASPVEVIAHTFHGQKVRTVTIDGAPWFVLNDVCNVLGLTNTRNVAARLDGDCVRQADVTDALGRPRATNAVNEPGLYDVILRSNSPNARPFRRWVTTDVLPTIRKHGAYLTPDAIEEAITNPDFIIKLASELKTERERRIALEEPAANWNTLASVDGHHNINDVGRILQNDGIPTSPVRIYQQLAEIGWIGHPHQAKRWRPLQKAIENGWAREAMGAVYRNRVNGCTVQGDPRTVITTAGVAKLRKILKKKEATA